MNTARQLKRTIQYNSAASTQQIMTAAIELTGRRRRDFATHAGMPISNDIFRYLQPNGSHVMAENLAQYLRGNMIDFSLNLPPYISYRNEFPVADITKVGYILSNQPYVAHFAQAACISKPHIKRLWEGSASTTIDNLLHLLAANDVPFSFEMAFRQQATSIPDQQTALHPA